jgi:excisionase family DNA binding protein
LRLELPDAPPSIADRIPGIAGRAQPAAVAAAGRVRASPSALIWIEQPEPRPEPVLLTIAEVAAALRMSEKSVQRRIKAGVIRTAPTGGRLVRISSDELRRLAAGEPLEAP